MPQKMTTTDRQYETVTSLEIRIGDEKVSHNFGRKVSMAHARKWAQHYLDVFTGEESTFTANEASALNLTSGASHDQ